MFIQQLGLGTFKASVDTFKASLKVHGSMGKGPHEPKCVSSMSQKLREPNLGKFCRIC